MLDALCAETRNYFIKTVYDGHFVIENGIIALGDKIANGQYFCISGSVFNDGVHRYGDADLTDEAFDGEIWAMAVPPSAIELAAKIKKYEESDDAKKTAYVSESFNGYSYTKATDGNGAPLSWKKVFRSELNQWRKI